MVMNDMRENELNSAKYICPRTRKALEPAGDFLKSSDGAAAYGVKNGIPQFLRFTPAEDRATEAQLEELNRLASEKGWKSALAAVYGKDPVHDSLRD